jgi:hypothetical protein
VNGLAIGGASRGIEDYYLAEVIHGPGAFVEYARNHDDFEEVMRRKLERELRVVILGELAENAPTLLPLVLKTPAGGLPRPSAPATGAGGRGAPAYPTGNSAAPTRRPSDNSTL